jgi:S-adenosylmethionine:tRNA ribosyltransferase-isomerase
MVKYLCHLTLLNPKPESEQYQTVYAQHPGAIAAPTAGLHFTPELLQRLRDRGINQAFVTLHVGVGTFRPVEVENVSTHKMHEEWISVPPATVEQIRVTKASGRTDYCCGNDGNACFRGSGSIWQFASIFR